ncbi:leucyl aminopeptidase [Magnetospira sp. QH-2]|uniref:leucyl aminopeptidase n=1 Tax=Magnetospira sp. (strain QH-2) TaxID=1288970 RepID=UPI0003E81795|nr:leucyl aminopeptidase [Magnetospira sp. QH-2]CCQ72834.1 Putative cytosol aminopeptidase (Leucine aminopeptidase) (LAP) (Leucyl aminopeptidase) PepA [Magnetospira sp. QH-2]
MKITFAKPALPETGTLVVTALDGGKLSPTAQIFDERTDGALGRAIKTARYKGKKGQGLSLLAPTGTGLDRLYVIGLGKAKDLNDLKMQDVGGTLYASLAHCGASSVSVALDDLEDCGLSLEDMAAHLAFGARLRTFRFDKYRTKEEKGDKPKLKTFKIHGAAVADAKATFAPLDKIADGVFLTRTLASEPANVLYPESFAKEAQKLSDLGVKVKVLGEKEMTKLGMGALLGVGQGSIRESKMVTLEWNGTGAKKSGAPIAFVGKGVCFDSGGISIKPSPGMEDMKWDMGGAGVVTGLMAALAGRKAKVHAVGVIGLVENMPSGEAQRPGDVVTSMSGQTIEVINTDAEGRLVLADALHYCNETYQPKFMIDLATLTGAIIIGLGEHVAGTFSNDDDLAEAVSEAGKAVGEGVWRLPIGEEWDKQIKSDIADMRNVGGRAGGSITAAQFLKRFVGDTPWLHIDIAGVTWSKKDKPTVPKGGTGFGVRLLDRLVADKYEKD